MTVIASRSLFNSGSINIHDVIYGIDDFVLVGINDNKPRKYKLYYTPSKGAYFNLFGHREYLIDYLTNY